MRSTAVHRASTRAAALPETGGQTDEDIAAIFEYLTTLKPVAHRVTTAESEPPTFCPICRQVHGYGNQNRIRTHDSSDVD